MPEARVLLVNHSCLPLTRASRALTRVNSLLRSTVSNSTLLSPNSAMSYPHPFGGWDPAAHSSSATVSDNPWQPNPEGTVPTIFGSLPSLPTLPYSPTFSSPPGPAGSPPRRYIFTLTAFNPDVTNCTVLGPQRRPIAYIVSEPQMPGYTTIRGLDGKGLALIEWQEHPLVEVRGVFSKRRTKEWLALNEERTSRSMDVSAMRYMWTPQGGFINLYLDIQAPRMLGRIARSQDSIILELSAEAMQLGLLDTALVATLLLQCGRNID